MMILAFFRRLLYKGIEIFFQRDHSLKIIQSEPPDIIIKTPVSIQSAQVVPCGIILFPLCNIQLKYINPPDVKTLLGDIVTELGDGIRLGSDPQLVILKIKLHHLQHDLLVEVMERFDTDRLDDHAGGEGQTTFADLITGIVLHDTYHAGQIQMMKRLARSHGV